MQLISLNKRRQYMYSFNKSFLSLNLKIGSETFYFMSQGIWFQSQGPECLIHFCQTFVLAE